MDTIYEYLDDIIENTDDTAETIAEKYGLEIVDASDIPWIGKLDDDIDAGFVIDYADEGVYDPATETYTIACRQNATIGYVGAYCCAYGGETATMYNRDDGTQCVDIYEPNIKLPGSPWYKEGEYRDAEDVVACLLLRKVAL